MISRSSVVPARRPRWGRAALAAIATTALVFAGTTAAQAAGSEAGTVGGFVFRDFNSNGAYDTGALPGSGDANDVALPGVTATAYDAHGDAVGSAVSDATGAYSIPVAAAYSQDVRVEFTFSPAQVAEGYQSSAHGPDNGTSVQFAVIGDTDVDFGALVPEDYVQGDARVAITAQRPGNPLIAGYPDDGLDGELYSSVVSIGYEQSSSNATDPTIEALVFDGGHGIATGSLYGIAAPRGDDSFYASAVLRRHAGVGEAGLGAIYAIDPTTHVATLLVDLDNGTGASAGNIDVGESTLSAAVGSTGSAGDNAARGLVSDPDVPTYDEDVWSLIGTIGIGGLAASTDGTKLYAINLNTKSLIIIDIALGTASEVSLGALGADDRPFAVAVHRGQVFVSVTDTAASTGARADLGARVYSTPEASIASPTWTEALAITDLTFARGAASNGAFGTPNWTSDDLATHWNAWTDDWNAGTKTLFGPSGENWVTNAQPLLSSMTFDVDGNLVLGFLDRYTFQVGQSNYSINVGDTAIYSGIASGGIYGASPDGDGTYTLENNGTLGGVVGAGANNNRGPGGGQFYVTLSGAHSNAFTGAVAAAPGFSTFLGTAYDLSGGWTSDAGWMPIDGSANTATNTGWTATQLAQRVINNAPGDNGPLGASNGYGKAGGLGGVTLLAEAAPVEIGNRVWFDADQDGIQDADEPGIAGVTVNLLDADGEVIGTVVTDADGEYYFSVEPGTDYTVQFVVPTTGSWDGGSTFGQVPWSSFQFTDPDVGGNPAIDSDAVPTGSDSVGEAPVSVGGPGQNDHTIDAGLLANVQFAIAKLVDPAGGDAPPGATYTMNVAAIDFRGDSITASPGSVSVEVGGESDPVSVPVGAAVLVTEASAPGVDAVDVAYPASWSASAIDSDYLLVTEDDGELLVVEVTNTFAEPGSFSVTKQLGDTDLQFSDLGDVSFTIAVTVDGTPAAPIVLDADNGFTYESPDYPAGTVVTLEETSIDGAPLWAGWGDPAWSIGDGDGDGIASITIEAGSETALTLTNPLSVLEGSVGITKSVAPDAAALLPDDFEGFVVEYSTDGGTTWTPLTPAIQPGETVTSPSFPVGTEVLFREDPASIPVVDGIEWGTPFFSGSGTQQGDGSFLVVIEEDANGTPAISLTLNNPTEVSGQFSLLKDITGPGETLVESGTTFSVTYSYDGQTGGPQTVTLTPGITWSSADIPAGTVVTISEVVPTGGLPTGATWGTPVLRVDGGAPIANGSTITIGDATTVAVVVENPTDVTPTVEITKGDGDVEAGTIEHEAETVTDGEVYAPGETRDIVIRVVNTGPEPLVEVELDDVVTAGSAIQSLEWTFPRGGGTVAATWDAGTQTWSATWAATFGAEPVVWEVGDVIIGRATLTIPLSDLPHQDIASVDAVGAFSGKPVDDDNPYNAFTGGIQVIKYDGERPDPEVGGPGAWVIPTKPLASASQDANTPATAVPYPISTPQKVRWVVTNTGTTWLTNVTLTDVTLNGPAVGADWTADLSDFGGPADYSFNEDGPWPGLFPPGASFFAEGTLTLGALANHGDLVVVEGTQVVPATDPDTGLPTDEPLIGDDDRPVIALDDEDRPVVYTDQDPFHATTPAKPLQGTGQAGEPAAVAGFAGLLLLGGAALVLGTRRRRRRIG